MKMHFKSGYLLLIGVLFTLVCFAAGCGGTGSTQADKPTKVEISMDDIQWTVGEGINDGERCTMLTYTNNSQYDIISFKIEFTEKDGLSEEERNKFFEEVYVECGIGDYLDSDWVDDEIAEEEKAEFEELKSEPVTMYSEINTLVNSGNTSPGEELYYYDGFYSLAKNSHYDFVEPDIATIQYIQDDKVLTAYYDFGSDAYTMDSEISDAHYQVGSELAGVMPEIDAPVVLCFNDSGDYVDLRIMGWSEESFRAYVDLCKEQGFTIDKYENDDWYKAENQEGYEVNCNYDCDTYSMDFSFTAPDGD